MSILLVIYGKDEKNAINVTDVILENYVNNNVLCIPRELNFNKLKYDPFPGEIKKLYIKFCIKDTISFCEFDEDRICDVTINLNIESFNEINNKNIIIYPHTIYGEDDGGINVMYNLAKILDEMDYNVRIYPTYGYIKNPTFNKYYVHDFSTENAMVIYCEGTQGNPLKSKKTIRWMLSELGSNVPNERVLTFGKNELVYFFNNEKRFDRSPDLMGNIYKMLSLLYINPLFFNKVLTRDIECVYTIRKQAYRNKIIPIHPKGALELRRGMPHVNVSELFNRTKIFISYDPLTFLSILSAICGCISIIAPLEGKTKQDWLSMTAIKEYLNCKGIDNLYGIAYGIEDMKWALDTIHMAHKQWLDIIDYYKNKHVRLFLNDIENYDKQENTIANVYFLSK